MKGNGKKSATATLKAPVPAPTRIPQAETAEKFCPHGGVALEEAIRVRAYQKWERAGRPPGNGVSFWVEAEAELKACQ